MRVLARRGERFLVLGEPAEENLGPDAPRARAAGRAEACTQRSATAKSRRGRLGRFGWGAKITEGPPMPSPQ